MAVAVLPAAVGCAPARLTEGIHYAARRYGVADASTVSVRNKGYLRFDASLRADLDELLQPEASVDSEPAIALLQAARELSDQRTADELDRMPPDGLAWLADHYDVRKPGGDVDAQRDALKRQYSAEADHRLEDDVARLRNSSDAHRFLRAAQRRLEQAPGDRGRRTRALLAAPLYIPAAIGAKIADAEAMDRAMGADFERAIEYRPRTVSLGESVEDLSSLDLPDLAAHYAPVFVQQIDPHAPFDANADRIGRVFLTGSAADLDVNVDPAQPVVYWAHSQARIQRSRYDQLTYVVWYPSRPALSSGDLEAGDIDGVIVRITLDSRRRPAVYEFMRSCGCYHTLWVAEFLETAASNEFGPPTDGHGFAIQRDVGEKSLFIAGLVRQDDAQSVRPMVFVDSGQHLVVAIKPSGSASERNSSVEEANYALAPYESLTRLPLGNGVASMFGSDGLVHNAGRKEGYLLAPTGMLSAGQPRQLGTMKIRMDAYDQDDPRLLERSLRFPSGF